MIRVTFSGPELAGFPEGREGANCKLMLPEPGEDRATFVDRLTNGPAPARRTYTLRHYRPELLELDIDFVAHGDNGPASRWASHAQHGDFLGFAGPSQVKLASYHADWYLVAAATLEAMPRNAKGDALFEITSEDDRQDIDAPEGIDMHWLVHHDPTAPSTQQEEFIRALHWPDGCIQTCIAGEAGVVRALRAFLHQEKYLPRENTYISGYWKIGLVEEEHKKEKRAAALI